MKVLIDTNVILDVLIGREPFLKESATVVLLSEKAVIDGYVSASTATDIFYIVRKEFQDKDNAYNAIEKLFQAVKVALIDGETIDEALRLRRSDFEDCMQFVAAQGIDADFIVTRNVSDFKDSSITPITPSDFLDLIGHGQNVE